MVMIFCFLYKFIFYTSFLLNDMKVECLFGKFLFNGLLLSQVSHLCHKQIGQVRTPYCFALIVFIDAINIRRIAPQSF